MAVAGAGSVSGLSATGFRGQAPARTILDVLAPPSVPKEPRHLGPAWPPSHQALGRDGERGLSVLPGSHLGASSRGGGDGGEAGGDLIPSCILSCKPVRPRTDLLALLLWL